MEPRKGTNSRGSHRPREQRMATSTQPNNADLAATIPPGSESSASTHMPEARKSGDLASASPPVVGGRQPREGEQPQCVVNAGEESDAPVVPEKPVNSGVTPEESVEGRGAANGKLGE